MTKAFGKHDLDGVPPRRAYELFFSIPSPVGPEAWKSPYQTIQNLLDHLARFSRSEASRRTYLGLIMIFCQATGFNPDQLILLPETKSTQLVQRHIDNLATKGMSKSYVNTVNKRLNTFYRVNGITLDTVATINQHDTENDPSTYPQNKNFTGLPTQRITQGTALSYSAYGQAGFE